MTAVWTFGDSITAGTWLADPGTQSWPSRLDALLGDGVQVRNLGVGGQAVAYADPGGKRMDAWVLESLAAVPAVERPAVVLFAGGLNDMIRNTDVGPTRQAIFELGNRIASWYPTVRFLVMTITPYRSDAGYAVPLSERRATLNAWIRAQYGPAGQLVDTGDLLTAGATYADVRYFLDHLHPDEEGTAILAHGVHDQLKEKGLPCP